MDQTSKGFQYLKGKCGSISDAKLKAGVFIGPQIREIVKDQHFDSLLTDDEGLKRSRQHQIGRL